MWAALLAAVVLATPIALLSGAPPASPAPVTDAYSYAANGGTGTAPASGSGLDGTTVTLAANTFTDPGYTFAGWNDGTTTYAAGATYLLSSGGTPIVFTAQWTAAPTASVLVPSTGATLLGSNYLDASAYNATSVEFLLFGGTYGFAAPVICTATPTPYGWLCAWNTTTVPNGSYALVAEASNSTGNAFSSGVSIAIDNPLMGYSGNPTGARVALDGDSITGLSEPDLQATLEPTYQINLYDQPGWRIAQVAPAVTMQVTSTPPPDAVVINLGTNDVIQNNPTWQADYNSMFATVQNIPCVVLFNINRIVDDYNTSGTVTAEQINAFLAALASVHPNVHIIDWDAAVQANISLLTFDFIHPSPTGQQWIAENTKMALDSCNLPTYPSSSP